MMFGLVNFYGVGFDQMILSVGLEINDNSILAFSLIVLMNSVLLVLSMIAILILHIREWSLQHADKMIIKNPDRKEFWEAIKRVIE